VTKRPRSKPKPENGVPAGLSKRDRAQAVANAIINLQRQDLELTLLQEANDHDDDDQAPGMGGGTYGEQRAVFTEGQKRLVAKHRDLMPMVEGFIAGMHAQQAASE
jgi:hypothetical protein